MVDQFPMIRSFSTVSCGLLLGSTAWAGLAVMPSIIAAQCSTHAKLAVFDGLITRAGVVLPPVFLGSITSLAYLSYYSLGPARTAYLVAAGSLLGALGLQVVIVPKNKEMQHKLTRGEASKEDSGSEGGRLIGEILYWNWGRVVLSAISLCAVLYAAEYDTGILDATGTSIAGDSMPVMAARKLEYGLE